MYSQSKSQYLKQHVALSTFSTNVTSATEISHSVVCHWTECSYPVSTKNQMKFSHYDSVYSVNDYSKKQYVHCKEKTDWSRVRTGPCTYLQMKLRKDPVRTVGSKIIIYLKQTSSLSFFIKAYEGFPQGTMFLQKWHQ